MFGGARNGRGGALLILGEPGIGKTSMLRSAIAHPAGMNVLRLDGFEAESTIPFAAVQRLMTPLRKHLASLPHRHHQALLVATGVADGPAPDRFLVGLGMLGLLAAASGRAPVVCAVDDAHHLDPESVDVLAFVARRVQNESAVLLFAGRRDKGLEARFSGVEALALRGLGMESAVQLLNTSLATPVDPSAAAGIVHATGGNPLALVDLAQELSVRELTELGLAEVPPPVGRHLEEHYGRRVREAGADGRLWMLLAAADSTGNVDLIEASAALMNLPTRSGEDAEAAGLVTFDTTVRFRHPLVRSAAYNAASAAERRRVHGALSQAADQLGLVELEAWHASKSVVGTDEAVADRLEYVADLAGKRGGFASRAGVLSRAAQLTHDDRQRDHRRVAAAEAALMAGAAQVSTALLYEVDERAVDPVTHGRITVLRCLVSLFTSDGPSLVHATARLLTAADDFHGRAPEMEQMALLRAFQCCMPAERLIQGVTLASLALRFREASTLVEGAPARILFGLSAMIERPYEEAVPVVRDAVSALDELDDQTAMELAPVGTALNVFLWDEAGRRSSLARAAMIARDAGALQQLDTVLWIMALSELTGGSVHRAVQYNEQVRELRRAIGYDAENVVNAALMAWTGAPREQVLAIADAVAQLGFGGVESSAIAALAARDLAEGHYRDVYERLQPLVEHGFLHVAPTYYPDFVEAATRAGHLPVARDLAQRLTRRAQANGSPWCRGLAERCLALVGEEDEAERHYQASLSCLEGTSAIVDRARTHLLFGEWLRRTKRRREARHQLDIALDLFHRAGASIFEGRTRSELEATGARPGVTGSQGGYGLTPQELAIARLAAGGQTNVEIGGSLFISPNTVDYHLRKVFQKVGISSRRQLVDKMSGTPGLS
jgi:DNA-binding CsgD family transcriptional regulator